MIISCNGLTTAGRVKSVNQDAFYFAVTRDKNSGVFVVADGVGGLDFGEIASSSAIKETEKWWSGFLNKKSIATTEETVDELSNLAFRINSEIQKINAEKETKSATTFSLLLIIENNYFIVHIGDSRIYAVDKSDNETLNLSQLTRDHSKLVQREVDGRHIVQNMLTDGLGYKKSINCDCSFGVLNNKIGGFILCSDGVFKRQSKDVIAKIISENGCNPEGVCKALAENAMSLGESDNITAMLVNVN